MSDHMFTIHLPAFRAEALPLSVHCTVHYDTLTMALVKLGKHERLKLRLAFICCDIHLVKVGKENFSGLLCTLHHNTLVMARKVGKQNRFDSLQVL